MSYNTSPLAFQKLKGEPNRTATILLPLRRPQRPRLNHEKSHIYCVDRAGLWSLVTGTPAKPD